MVDKFEVGKYYRWIKQDGGETARICPWPPEQEVIGKMMDGVPRRCDSYDGKYRSNCGGHVVTWERFESKFNLWHPSDFDLVPEPPEGWRYLANGERYAPGNKVFTGSCFKDIEITSGVYESWNTSPVIVPITPVSQPEIVEYQDEKWRELGPDEPGEIGDLISLPERGIDTASKLHPCNYGKTPKGFERRMWRKVKDTPKEMETSMDRVCENCGERNGKHFGDDSCHDNAGGVTGTSFSYSGKTRTEQFETDHPIFDTIRNLNISQATKAYALFAVQRIIENDETQDSYIYKEKTIGGFCRWSATKEGNKWWKALAEGSDPGVPGETKDAPDKLVDIKNVPVGARVRIPTDGYCNDIVGVYKGLGQIDTGGGNCECFNYGVKCVILGEEKKMGSEAIREALNESTVQLCMMDGWHNIHVSSGNLVFLEEQKPSFKSESEIWAKVLGSIKS